MIKVKICGITNLTDAKYCAETGADFLGFVFYKKSSRYISPEKVKKIISQLPESVLKVGVFVNEPIDSVKRIAKECLLDYLQFHGDENPEYLKNFKGYKVIKAIRVKSEKAFKDLKKYPVSLFLFDTFKKDKFGGTGETFNWELLKEAKKLKKPFFVSGGLIPENVGELLGSIKPFAVDVSSGVEKSTGKKDKEKVRKFITIVKR